LDLPAEVGVPGGIDDVDARAAILDGAVLGEDGNATLAFDVVGIHDALAEPLVGGEGARLFQQAVDQRGLAVVDVRDDGDVADRAIHGWLARERRRAWARGRAEAKKGAQGSRFARRPPRFAPRRPGAGRVRPSVSRCAAPRWRGAPR